MAKRFIDTRMFEDEWVCSLSKDAKLFFIYYITTCDHAGILKLNRSLCEFQTKLKTFDTVIQELGNSLVTLKENVFFMPKFIKFQYPNFPQSNVKQQDGALKILFSYGITTEKLNSYLSLSKEFNNSYDNDNVIVVTNNIDERILKFAETLRPYIEKFGKELVTDFYKYWTEKNKSGTKFRQELEKTWDLNRRIEKWASNDRGFNLKKSIDPRNPKNLRVII
jgi:hypothetical protein